LANVTRKTPDNGQWAKKPKKNSRLIFFKGTFSFSKWFIDSIRLKIESGKNLIEFE